MSGSDGEALAAYRAKRDFSRTPEPAGAAPADAGQLPRFVVQEHHATALHWDFRLERDGVGVSWAVPKGLPTDPAARRLAVPTEDHPLDYFSFAGEIPAGEYGGGRVGIWDAGGYEPLEWQTDPQTGRPVKVKVRLHGRRARGVYLLVRTQRTGQQRSGREQWMMRLVNDPEANSGAGTGATAGAAAPGWQPLPRLVAPMLAVPCPELPREDAGWAYEFKWDGVRAVVYVEGGRPRVMSRNGNDVTGHYPELRAMAEELGSTQVVLDGEIVAFDADGRPSFERLQRRMHVQRPTERLRREVPVSYLVFDVLHHEGRSLLDSAYDERRALLESLRLAGPCWAVPPAFPGDATTAADMLAASREQGLEGVVAKRRDSRYFAGRRSDCWLKVKHVHTADAVVCGWQPGEGNRSGGIGSLILGVQTSAGLVFAGSVGSGLGAAALREWQERLTPLASDDPPYDVPVPRGSVRQPRWVAPELVVEVAFTGWTSDGKLRHPVYRGLRADVDPAEVTGPDRDSGAAQ